MPGVRQQVGRGYVLLGLAGACVGDTGVLVGVSGGLGRGVLQVRLDAIRLFLMYGFTVQIREKNNGTRDEM